MKVARLAISSEAACSASTQTGGRGSVTSPMPRRMIGFCGLQPLDGTTEVEIGWWLALNSWGQGLATEAARRALQDGFERAGLARIVAVALAANRASIHVMEKLGMKYERDMVHRGFEVVLHAVNRPNN